MSQDRSRLEDIQQAARRIQRFVADVEAATFRRDDKLQSAVIFQLLIIGEATKHLSEDLQSAYEEVPWSKMARMRDRLIHGYFDMDVEIVWTTVTRDIPVLLDDLERIMD